MNPWVYEPIYTRYQVQTIKNPEWTPWRKKDVKYSHQSQDMSECQDMKWALHVLSMLLLRPNTNDLSCTGSLMTTSVLFIVSLSDVSYIFTTADDNFLLKSEEIEVFLKVKLEPRYVDKHFLISVHKYLWQTLFYLLSPKLKRVPFILYYCKWRVY